MNFLKKHAKRGNYPLRSLLLLVVVGPMVFASLLIGLINWANSKAAIAESSDRLFEESSRAVAGRLSGLLSSAAMIDLVNYHSLQTGDLDTSDIRGVEIHLLALLRSNPAVSSVYVGSPGGGLVDAGREGPGGSEYLIETPGFVAGSFTKYSIDGDGRKTGIVATIPSFDARTRPWYTQAVARQGLVWTGIFPLFTGQDSTISAARPVYSRKGKFLAVVSVDLFLSQIASNVRELGSEDVGISYIINRDGYLVVSPSDASIYSPKAAEGKMARLSATESVDPRIAASAIALRREMAEGPSGKPYVVSRVGSKRFLAFSALLDDPAGRDWRIVTIYPEELILGNVDRIRDVTVMSMLFGIVLLGLLSFLMTGYIVAKVKDFSAFADAVAQGQWDESIELAPSSVREVEAFRGDLLDMRDKLRADFDELRAEVERRKQSEKALEESQHAYDRLTGHIPVGIYRATSDKRGLSRYDYVSARYLKIYGFPPGTILVDNGPEISLIHPDDRPSFLAEMARADSSATPFLWEGRILVEGQLRRVRKESTPTVEANGDILWDGMLTDITDAWLASERITSLLAEKELLLHEVHHRIKNNMGSMMALLSMQAQSSEEASVRAALHDAESRLGSMMLLYDKLYRSESVTSMDASVYLADIADSIELHQARARLVGQANAKAGDGPIRVEKELQSLSLDASILMPIGIVANELITNAYKHAFPEGREGRIKLKFSVADDVARLIVEDDGKGMDGKTEGLGFGHAVVEGLARQLDGRLSVVSDGGTRFELIFPIPR